MQRRRVDHQGFDGQQLLRILHKELLGIFATHLVGAIDQKQQLLGPALTRQLGLCPANEGVEGQRQGGEIIANFAPPFTLLAGSGLEGGRKRGQKLDQTGDPTTALGHRLEFGTELLCCGLRFHHVAKPALQRLKGLCPQNKAVSMEPFQQGFSHGHQHFGVLQVVAVQLGQHIHLHHIKPPRCVQLQRITAQFGGLADADMAKEQDVLFIGREEDIADGIPAKLARQAGEGFLAAPRFLRIHISGILIGQRLFVLNFLQDFEQVAWGLIVHRSHRPRAD